MAARDIFRNGLDAQNPALVQLLGLCPLLAVSTSAGSALGLGLATLTVLVTSNLIASVLGRWLLPEIRLAVFVLTIAGAVTAVELSLAAWWPGLHDSLGIFLPLIVTNCLVLARAEAFASRQTVGAALLDAVAMGLGFLLVLLALGSARELLGRGSLGADLGLLLGGDTAGSGIQIIPAGHGLLLALLPPGAFVLLGLMLAARNWRRQQKSSATQRRRAGRRRPCRHVNARRVHAIFERLRARNPQPKTELEYASPFELLVAVILSAQATDKSVNVATRRLFADANTPQSILALGVDGLAAYVKSIGLYQGKAKNIIATCRLLIDEHGGRVPDDRDALEALPGVGRKTANVILNTAFGQPTLAVDTHVFRVANRTGLARAKDVRAVEDGLLKCIPAEFLHDAHHWLILQGRYVCKAAKPDCPNCAIADLCEYEHKTVAAAAATPARTRGRK